MMRLWEPKTCCCCASPRTGALILGWMGFVGSVLNILSVVKYVAYSRQDFRNICTELNRAYQDNTYNSAFDGTSVLSSGNEIINPQFCAEFMPGFVIGNLLMNIASAVMNGLLLWGVYKNKPKLMLPYLVTGFIGSALLGLMIVVLFIILCYFNQVLAAFLTLIILGGILFFEVYLLLVVRVCYKEVSQIGSAMRGNPDVSYMEQRDLSHLESHYTDYNNKP